MNLRALRTHVCLATLVLSATAASALSVYTISQNPGDSPDFSSISAALSDSAVKGKGYLDPIELRVIDAGVYIEDVLPDAEHDYITLVSTGPQATIRYDNTGTAPVVINGGGGGGLVDFRLQGFIVDPVGSSATAVNTLSIVNNLDGITIISNTVKAANGDTVDFEGAKSDTNTWVDASGGGIILQENVVELDGSDSAMLLRNNGDITIVSNRIVKTTSGSSGNGIRFKSDPCRDIRFTHNLIYGATETNELAYGVKIERPIVKGDENAGLVMENNTIYASDRAVAFLNSAIVEGSVFDNVLIGRTAVFRAETPDLSGAQVDYNFRVLDPDAVNPGLSFNLAGVDGVTFGANSLGSVQAEADEIGILSVTPADEDFLRPGHKSLTAKGASDGSYMGAVPPPFVASGTVVIVH